MSKPLITLMGTALDGGIGRNLINLANAFHDMGYAVHVLLNKPGGPYLQLLGPGVGVHHMRRDHHVFGIPSLAAYMLKYRPAVILAPVPRLTILALRTCRLLFANTRVFANVHNTYGRAFGYLSPRKRRRRIDKIRRYYPRCAGIIPVSNGVADDLSELTGLARGLMTVIYNPGVTDTLQEQAGAPVDHPWFAERQPPVIVMVTRLSIAKNIPLAIAAFEAVRDQVECRLAIIGDGTLRPEIEQRIVESRHAQDITLLGHQVNPFRYLSRAALFVMSSNWEGAPNTLAEAMAVGCPIVSTDCPSGPREILDGGRYGVLVPTEDAAALADGIRRMLSDPTPREVLRERARCYDAGAIARQYLACFGLLTNGTGQNHTTDRVST